MTFWTSVEPQKRKCLWLWIVAMSAVCLVIGALATSVVQGENKEFSRALDKATALTIGLSYLIINLVLPIAAYAG